MKRLSILASIVALGVVALAVPTTASASCGTAIVFNQGGYACGGYYCYITSPGTDDIAAIQADFWSLGTGNPAVGLGDDDGSRANDQWLTRYSPAYGIYMIANNNWSQPGIDGCIDNQGPVATQKMIAAFGDQDPSGNTAYWAVSGALRDPAAGAQFNFSGNPPANITLVEIPAVAIVGSTKVSDTQVDVDIQCPNLNAGGFYTDGNVLFSEAVQGCAIFQQQIAGIGAAAPSGPGSRSLGSGWSQIGTIANGQVGTVTLSGCNATTDNSNYLGIAIQFDSGFTTQYVGPNSNRVECGPNVANPTPRFKIIDKEPKGKGQLRRD